MKNKLAVLIAILCLFGILCAAAVASVSAEEYRGYIELELDRKDHSYVVMHDVTWDEDGQLCGAQRGDVFGIYVDPTGRPVQSWQNRLKELWTQMLP